MKLFKLIAALSLCLAFAAGCSEKTKQEGKEALDATGEAIGSAVEDGKENVKKVGGALKAGVDETKKELSDPETPATTN